jgi:hemoglobin
MGEASDALFSRLGGSTGLHQIVDDMYRRVLADEELSPFFAHVTMERLRRMQFQFLASALDGPVNYAGSDLTAIHANRGITGYHFAKFCNHFADAMEAHGAAPRDVDDALGRLATYKDKITGDANVDG